MSEKNTTPKSSRIPESEGEKVLKKKDKKKEKSDKKSNSEKPTGEVAGFLDGSEKGNEAEASSAPEESETVTPKAQKAQKVAESVKKLNDEMAGVKQNLDVIMQFIMSKEGGAAAVEEEGEEDEEEGQSGELSPILADEDVVEEGEVVAEPIRRLSFSPAAASAEPTPSKPTPKRSALSKERLGLLSMERPCEASLRR